MGCLTEETAAQQLNEEQKNTPPFSARRVTVCPEAKINATSEAAPPV